MVWRVAETTEEKEDSLEELKVEEVVVTTVTLAMLTVTVVTVEKPATMEVKGELWKFDNWMIQGQVLWEKMKPKWVVEIPCTLKYRLWVPPKFLHPRLSPPQDPAVAEVWLHPGLIEEIYHCAGYHAVSWV